MTEKGENVKNYQTNKGLLESKLSKYILGDCTFINFMQKIPLILNLCHELLLKPVKQLQILLKCVFC